MKKILVVEDDSMLRKILVDELHRHQYQVFDADNGQSGLATAKLQKPDLILLDVRMPFMDGMAMLAELRKDDYGKAAKVIILTNFDPNAQIAQQVIDLKPIYYFIKSELQLEELMEKIHELLENNV